MIITRRFFGGGELSKEYMYVCMYVCMYENLHRYVCSHIDGQEMGTTYVVVKHVVYMMSSCNTFCKQVINVGIFNN
jgi:hypothetical protein